MFYGALLNLAWFYGTSSEFNAVMSTNGLWMLKCFAKGNLFPMQHISFSM